MGVIEDIDISEMEEYTRNLEKEIKDLKWKNTKLEAHVLHLKEALAWKGIKQFSEKEQESSTKE